MKLFLYSKNLTGQHFVAFRELLGVPKARKALFITSASIPYGHDPKPEWLVDKVDEMADLTENFDEVTLEIAQEIPTDLSQYDFIFIAGGNVFYLAYMLEKTGFGEKIKKYAQDGGFLVGSSAGGAILTESLKSYTPADDPSKAPKSCSGLGLIDFAMVPHADSLKYGELIGEVIAGFEKDGIETVSVGDSQVLVVSDDRREII